MTGQKERDFIELLEEECGFTAMRAPGSGTRVGDSLDVVAWRTPHVPEDIEDPWAIGTPLVELWGFEHKYRTRASSYFDKEDVEQSRRVAEDSNIRVRLACRFSANKSFTDGRDTSTYLVPLDEVPTTKTKGKIEYDHVKQFPTATETLQR